MMNRAIILHGMPSKGKYYNAAAEDSQSNSHWLPWLQQQLCVRDVLAQTPELPRPFSPDYNAWKNEFERLAPDEQTLLVGHSCGGGFLVRWLSENPHIQVAKVVLVAPWLDIEKDYTPLFEFPLRRTIARQSRNGIEILYSTNDGQALQSSLQHLRSGLDDVRYHEFIEYGHFCLSDMKTRQFPELLSICLGS